MQKSTSPLVPRARSAIAVALVAVMVAAPLAQLGPLPATDEDNEPAGPSQGQAAHAGQARTSTVEASSVEASSMAGSGAAMDLLSGLRAGFEENEGQAPEPVRFIASTQQGRVLLMPDGLLIHADGHAVEMTFEDARDVEPVGRDRLPGTTNHLVGDRDEWATDVHRYASVVYPSVWPGIDVVVYTTDESALEYDLELAPHADPGAIELAFDGVDDVRVGEDGGLRLSAGETTFTQQAPVAHEGVDGEGVLVEARFTVDGNTVGVELGEHDPSAPVVVDPVVDYATIVGWDSLDEAFAIDQGPDGAYYVVGRTMSKGPILVDTLQQVAGGDKWDGFLAKVVPDEGLVYATFLGGSWDDMAWDVAVAPGGAAWVVGRTASEDFPATQEPTQGWAGFLVRLAPDGTAIDRARLVDGDGGRDHIRRMALGPDGDPHIVMGTNSGDGLALVDAFQQGNAGGRDLYVARYDADTLATAFASYLGGGDKDLALGLDVGDEGTIAVAAQTQSEDLQVVNATQASHGGGRWDGFFARIDEGNLTQSSYLGGQARVDVLRGVVVETDGDLLLAGGMASEGLATDEAYQPEPADSEDVYVARVAGDGTIEAATYLGGRSTDRGLDVELGPEGDVFLGAGSKSRHTFPTKGIPDHDTGRGWDIVVARLSGDLSELVYSLQYGDRGHQHAQGIVVDEDARPAVTGRAERPDRFEQVDSDVTVDTTHRSAYVLTLAPCGPESSITASENGTLGQAGWYVSDVLVAFNASSPCPVDTPMVRVDDGEFEPAENVTISEDGVHTVAYHARLTDETTSTTEQRQVRIDATPPNQTLVEPTPGSGVVGVVPEEVRPSRPPIILATDQQVEVDAEDELSGVDRVEFFVDDEHRATDAQAPYAFVWHAGNESLGDHTVTSLAYDEAGNAPSELSFTATTVPTTQEGVEATLEEQGILDEDDEEGGG